MSNRIFLVDSLGGCDIDLMKVSSSLRDLYVLVKNEVAQVYGEDNSVLISPIYQKVEKGTRRNILGVSFGDKRPDVISTGFTAIKKPHMVELEAGQNVRMPRGALVVDERALGLIGEGLFVTQSVTVRDDGVPCEGICFVMHETIVRSGRFNAGVPSKNNDRLSREEAVERIKLFAAKKDKFCLDQK